MPDRLAARQGLHADEAPAPVVDQAFQRHTEGVEGHFLDPFDQYAVAVQFHRIAVQTPLVQHGDAALELRRAHGEPDGRRRGDDVLGQWIDSGEVRCTGIHHQVGDAPEAIGCGRLLQLMNQLLQLGTRCA